MCARIVWGQVVTPRVRPCKPGVVSEARKAGGRAREPCAKPVGSMLTGWFMVRSYLCQSE